MMTDSVSGNRQEGRDRKAGRNIASVLKTTLGTGLMAVLAAVAQASAPTIKRATAPLADPAQAWAFFTNTTTYPNPTTHTTGVAAMPATAPEIVALARALGAGRYTTDQYAQRVFDYVRLNVETEFRFGLGKGPRGAAVDQSGSPFDQAALMVALLRQGGVSASYQVGSVVLTANEFGLWTGLVYNLNQANQTFLVDARAACTLLADGGIPATINGASSCTSVSGALSTVTLLHVWVTVNGKVYDPSYKRHILKTGIDVAAAMGCGSASAPTCGATMLSSGLQGAAQGLYNGVAPYVQNVNRSAIASKLNTYARNLQSSIQSSDRFAQLEDIAGGAIIDPNYSPAVSANLPYTSSQPGPFATWTGDIPNQFRTTLNVQFLGINQTLYLDELFGQRLRIGTLGPANTWTRTSKLYVEGNAVATATYAAGQGTQDIATLSINHPYAASASGSTTLDGTYADESAVLYAGQDYRDANRNYVYTGGGTTTTINDAWPNTITLVWALGRTGPGYQALMNELQATAGQTEIQLLTPAYGVPEQHPSEAASILVQQSLATKALEDVSKSKLSVHHTLGAVYAIYRDYTVSGMFNMTSMVSADSSNTNSTTDISKGAFATYALLMATMEGSVAQQIEDGWEAISSVSLLSHANDDQEPFLQLVTDSNSTAQSKFSSLSTTLANNGYGSGTGSRAANISQYIQNGYGFILPLKASPPCVSMSGGSMCLGSGGEDIVSANEIGFSIAERLKGDASVPQADPIQSTLQASQLTDYSLRSRHQYTLNTADGTITLSPPPDLKVGAQDYPASLQFKRTYSSSETAQETCTRWFGSNYATGLDCTPVTDGSYQTTLGNGWRHNFQISAEWVNNGNEAFALTSALRASNTLAAMFTMFDMAGNPNNTPSVGNTMSTVMLAYTMAGTLMKNSFVIHLPGKALTFVQLPDGTYDAPINEPSAQISTNAARNGPMMLGSPTIYYDYSNTTLQYRGGNGDVMNFAWNSMSLVQAGNVYPVAHPSFDVQDWTTPEGVKVQFTYANLDNTGSGRRQRVLTKVTNNLGHALTINGSTPSATITSVADETGRQVTFGTTNCTPSNYSYVGTLADPSAAILEDCRGTFTVTQADGQITSYSYMPDGSSPDPTGSVTPTLRLRKWFTPSSSTAPFLTITYDQQMHVASVVDASGNATSAFTASITNENDKLGETQDPLGAVTRKYFDLYDDPVIEIDPLGNVTSHSYDDARRLVQTVFPEKNAVSYQYDVRSNLLSTTTLAKPGTGLANIVARVTTYSEGPTVRACSNPVTCNKPATVKDANQNQTTYSYSGSTGQLLSITGPALTRGISGNPTTTYCYTSYGTTNADGSTSTPLSLLTGRIQQVATGTSRITSYSYNSSNHFAIYSSTVDPTTPLIPGAAGSLTCPNGSSNSTALNLITYYTFDSVGNIQTLSGPRTDLSDQRSYTFDKMRRLTRVVEPSLTTNGSGLNPITRYTYNADGELVTTNYALVASPTDSDPTSPWPSLTASQWQTETRTYWPTGNLKSVQDASNNTTQYTYDADSRLSMTADPDGRINATVYDAAGDVLCVWKGWNSSTPPGNCSWNPASYGDGSQPILYGSYTYTNNRKERTVTDADGNTTQYVYDGFDRLNFALLPDPDNGSVCSIVTPVVSGSIPTCSGHQTYEQYGYDSNNNRISLRTRKGDVIATTYNSLNLPDTKTLPDLPAVTYSYYLSGDSMSVTQGGHSTSYTYDGASRKHTENNDSLPAITYGYDQAGNRSSTLWPDGYQVSYVYNAINEMQDVHEGTASGPLLAHYDYDILKRRQTLTYAGNSGNSIGYTYEPDSRLSSLTHQMASAALTIGYSHNGSGQITNLSVTDDFYLPKPATPATTGYTFNALNEYTAVGPVTGTDSSGKPIIAGARGRIISIPFDDLQIVFPAVAPGRTPADTSADPGGNTVVHDLNGNLRRWTGPDGSRNVYTYDSENRLRTAITKAHNVAYDYDALGRRISKTVDGVQTGYLLDDNEEIAEYNMSSGAWPSTPARRYVMGPATDDRIVMVDATNSNSKTYYHANHEGSVLATTDSSGNVVQRLSYDEYGNLASGATTTGQVFRYTGRRFDAETGLYYYRARYYSPQIGRFLQTDPVGYEDDLNLYSYAHNDPPDGTDPDGTTTWCWQTYVDGTPVGPPHGPCWDDSRMPLLTALSILFGALDNKLHNNPYDPIGTDNSTQSPPAASAASPPLPPDGPDDEDGWDKKNGYRSKLTSLERQMISGEIKSNPTAGRMIMDGSKLKDPRFAGGDWAKYETQVTVRGARNTVHYMYNRATGEVAQIKLKSMGGSLVPP